MKWKVSLFTNEGLLGCDLGTYCRGCRLGFIKIHTYLQNDAEQRVPII